MGQAHNHNTTTGGGRMRQRRPITAELVRDLLFCIPADGDREEWLRLGMACKASGLDESTARDLWFEWSARGETFNARDAADTWRGIKASGGVTVGTLFAVARRHGFRFPDAEADEGAAPAPRRPADDDAARKKAQRKREAEEVQYRERADKAALAAERLWVDATPDDGDAPRAGYLRRKGVKGWGVRTLDDGTLLVPMFNIGGELMNVQRIAADKPAGDAPEKRFMPGGRKSGLMHALGVVDGSAPVLLAEGWATAASLHEATGRTAVVTFDAGNLKHVAAALRERWPDLPLLVCADDDAATAARTNKNPGRLAAAQAVRAAKGGPAGLVVPLLPDDGKPGEPRNLDFNDLHALAGLDEVRRQVDAACSALLDPAAGRRDAARADDAGGAGSPHAQAGPTARDEQDPQGQQDAAPGAVELPDRYLLDESGVWHLARDREGNERRPQWLCAPLRVAALTRNEDGNGWGLLLEFSDRDGRPKSWAMPSAMLSGEGAEWAGRLRDMGLRMAPGTAVRNLIAGYLDTRHPDDRATCTERVGWHGSTYVLPTRCIGPADGKRWVFQSESGVEDSFRQRGTLEQWQAGVAALALGNSRLIFSLCCAFAGPLLMPSRVESGGFHFRGGSTGGKTTALKVAASVYGRPTYMQRWRTTDNALESTAVQHCDALLILDEFGQLDPKVAGDCSYMLANQSEKARTTRTAVPRRRRTWRLLFLSSGEVSLAGHMAEAGKRAHAGQEVRMVDVPLDAGADGNSIEELHGRASPGALADELTMQAARFYGVAALAWIEWLAGRLDELPDMLDRMIDGCVRDLLPDAAAPQVRRVARRFALVAVAGELAGRAGITGWPKGAAAVAVKTCFQAWLAARGHAGNGEEAAMLAQVRAYLERNGAALFTWTNRAHDAHAPATPMRAGFRRLVNEKGEALRLDSRLGGADDEAQAGDRLTEYLILPEAFRREVCKGFEPDSVARLLARRGMLATSGADGDRRLTFRMRLPGMGLTHCYRILPSLFAADVGG